MSTTMEAPTRRAAKQHPPAGAGPITTMRQSGTLTWRSLAQIRHNPWELGELSIQPIIWVMMFALIFGGAIAGSTSDYVQFLLPGMLAMNAINAVMVTALGLSTDVQKGVYDRLMSLPISRAAPLIGRITSDALKQQWCFLVVLLTGIVLGFRPETGLFGVLAAAALMLVVCLCLVWIGVYIGVRLGDPEKVSLYSFAVVLPLTFTGSVFVDANTMPGLLRAWASINPTTVVADAFRALLIGGPEHPLTAVVWTLVWCAAVVIIFAPLATRALRRS